jgi:hypothetical protein
MASVGTKTQRPRRARRTHVERLHGQVPAVAVMPRMLAGRGGGVVGRGTRLRAYSARAGRLRQKAYSKLSRTG